MHLLFIFFQSYRTWTQRSRDRSHCCSIILIHVLSSVGLPSRFPIVALACLHPRCHASLLRHVLSQSKSHSLLSFPFDFSEALLPREHKRKEDAMYRTSIKTLELPVAKGHRRLPRELPEKEVRGNHSAFLCLLTLSTSKQYLNIYIYIYYMLQTLTSLLVPVLVSRFLFLPHRTQFLVKQLDRRTACTHCLGLECRGGASEVCLDDMAITSTSLMRLGGEQILVLCLAMRPRDLVDAILVDGILPTWAWPIRVSKR